MANKLRKRILELAYKKQAAHIGSCLSCVDIIDDVYANKNPEDIFVLSKGHASLALYAVLNKYGEITDEELDTYLDNGSFLGGHVTRHADKGLHVTAGSLGQGVAVAAGMAFANRDRQVYTLVGDGETNEGMFWETVNFAFHHELTNFHIYIDANGFQGLGDAIYTNYFRRLNAFTRWVDPNSVFDENVTEFTECVPNWRVYYTVKGLGVEIMEYDNSWHYNKLDEDTYREAVASLEDSAIYYHDSITQNAEDLQCKQ